MEVYNQNPPAPTDVPMDEFEAKPKLNPFKVGNIVHLLRYLGLLIVILLLVGGGIYAIRTFMANQSTTPIAKASATPKASASAKPVVDYPQEYQDLNTIINEYDRNTSNVPEKRTRIQYPQLDPGVSF
jgi:hypothetical protein